MTWNCSFLNIIFLNSQSELSQQSVSHLEEVSLLTEARDSVVDRLQGSEIVNKGLKERVEDLEGENEVRY